MLCPRGLAGSNPAAPTTYSAYARCDSLYPSQLSFQSEQLPAYSYLLGMYLGDGYISRVRRTYVLRIYLHERQHEIAARVRQAIRVLVPHRRVGRVREHGAEAGVSVTCYFGGWPALFPQHGRGKKCARPISLAPWQRNIVEAYPFEFVRGCLESDGCRHRRVVKGHNYPAYSFKNYSEDILRLFGEFCDRLGLRWRRANRVTISIARRADVARLDALFAGALRSPQAERTAVGTDTTPA